MSLTYDVESGAGEWYFPTSVWNRSFQFASDNGLIVVASAGNDGNRLPENSYVRPATRTPGTITVGALLSVEALVPGTYVLRVQPADAPSQSAASPLTVQRVPSFR